MPEQSYESQVLAKIWGIVKPHPESEYDVNNMYERILELVEAERQLAIWRYIHA